MATINLTAIANILEKVIAPSVTSQLRDDFVGWNIAKTEGRGDARNRILKFDNDNFYIPLQIGRHSGAVSIAESGKLVNGKPTLSQAKVACKWHTGSQVLTKQSLSVDPGAVVPVLVNMGKMLVDSMKADMSRQFWGTGDAVIGKTEGATGGATQLVFEASPNGAIDYAEYCPPGTQIKIGSGAVVEVASVDDVNTITIAASRAWSDADEVKKCDGDGTVATELTGIRTLLSNSAIFQNINPATVPAWKPAYLNSTAGQLQLNDLDPPFLKANKVGKCKYIFMNEPLFRRYGQLLVPMKEAANPKDVLSGGWKGLDYAGGNADVVLDWDVPDDHVIYWSPDFATWGENQALEWEKGTDGTLLRIAGKIDYEVVATMFGEFGFNKRAAFAALSGRTP